MFKKFATIEELTGSSSSLSSSDIRHLKKAILKSYPAHEPTLHGLLKKKRSVQIFKCKMKLKVVVVDGLSYFFAIHKGPFVPHLKHLHTFPNLLTKMTVDRGAVKHILNGADVMCRGLTSSGAKMEKAPRDAFVAIMVEGKKHAIGIGKMMLSTNEIRKKNSGIGIKMITHIADVFFRNQRIVPQI